MLSPSLIKTPIVFSPKRSVSSQSLCRKFGPRLSASTVTATATATANQKRRPPIRDYLNTPVMGTSSCSSLYQVLGIPVGTTSQEIKAAYRRLARACHPDVVAVDRKDLLGGDFMRIHAAYCTLSDPEKRAVYDGQIMRRRRRPLTAVVSSASGYGGRNWETDQCW